MSIRRPTCSNGNAFASPTVNRSASVRTVRQNGREYLVAPITLIVPGVLSGSGGPLYYPPEEIARNYRQWNGIPLVINHPHDPLTNRPQSANEAGVLARQGVGHLRNARLGSCGQLQADSYFDRQRLQRIAPYVLASLLQGNPIEQSTGLFTDNEETMGIASNGQAYIAVARNYVADHVAILPNQVGACSVKDGCGVLVNDAAYDNDMDAMPLPEFTLAYRCGAMPEIVER